MSKRPPAEAAIRFAVTIDDHFDRLEFLQGWLKGELAEWPEFTQASRRKPARRKS